MIGYIRQVHPRARVILGGGLITSWMQRFDVGERFSGWVDEVIAGPGEAPLLALHGVSAPISKAFTPCYDEFPWGDYLSPGPILPYSASDGCWWRQCAFCPEQTEGNRYRPYRTIRS